MMTTVIGKIAATEKAPTTIDEFFFWTKQTQILSPFDVVKVNHIKGSITFGVVEEISHITDSPSYLSNYISSDFGDITLEANMHRIGMNYVKAKVIGNTNNIYTPVLNGSKVSLASAAEVSKALGLDKVPNKLPCGYLEMYEGKDRITLPVNFNGHFLIGPEGAHLNISGISGLAAKTSYSMFLMRAIQELYKPDDSTVDVAFVFFNVKGRDLLAIDEANVGLSDLEKEKYTLLGLSATPFQNVSYYYPYSQEGSINSCSYGNPQDIQGQIEGGKGFKYKYVYEEDRENLDLLLANVSDTTGTMDSIISYIINGNGKFGSIESWSEFLEEVRDYSRKDNKRGDKEITVTSWRKFKRVISKSLSHSIFAGRVVSGDREVRISDAVKGIRRNEVKVIDIARLDQDTQAFVFGDVIRAIYNMKLSDEREEDTIPSRIIVFIDELNKYASTDIPKNSPILRQIIDIAERGRSLGIILFSVEQFRSAIHDRVKGNCSTHAYGRTNAIEVSKADYRFVPKVYKNMMTRLSPGEYILEHPTFRSLLNIKFPREVYKQFKNG